MRFAISRKREYMADAGSAEMTKNPLALASALRKISADPAIETVQRKDIAQLFIQNPKKRKPKAYIANSAVCLLRTLPLKSGLRYWNSSKFF